MRGSRKFFTLATIKRESDLDWCAESSTVPADYQEESYSEDDFKMVETAGHQQPHQIGPPSSIWNPHSFLGNMFFAGEGFKPVQKIQRSPQSTATAASSSSSSLFTIDSILAPRPGPISPQRPVLHHPLHIGHIAAAASASFGASCTSAEFLGELLFNRKYSLFNLVLFYSKVFICTLKN